MAVLRKVICRVVMCPRSSAPRNTPRRQENRHRRKHVPTDVDSSVVRCNRKVATNRMLI